MNRACSHLPLLNGLSCICDHPGHRCADPCISVCTVDSDPRKALSPLGHAENICPKLRIALGRTEVFSTLRSQRVLTNFSVLCMMCPRSSFLKDEDSAAFLPSPTHTHVHTHANFPSCFPSIFLKNNIECRLYCVCFILFTFEPPTEFSLNVNPEEHQR